MALKLFRSTGHSTLLMPGETRLAPHPGWLVLATSAWVAFVCNVAVWRLVNDPSALPSALAVAAVLGGGAGMILSILAWRRTLKAAVTLVLVLAALLACGLWAQQLPIESLWTQRPLALLPGWANFLRWQVPALFMLLAVLPVAWMWSVPLRRLPGPSQLQANIVGAAIAAAVFGIGMIALS
jgi:glucan phosphoethanolaminetransferase (alkaline phosphatase superfamily)